MKAFLIKYLGVESSGAAVVVAESAVDALMLLKDRPDMDFERWKGSNPLWPEHPPTITEIDMTQPNVVYNDNGDY